MHLDQNGKRSGAWETCLASETQRRVAPGVEPDSQSMTQRAARLMNGHRAHACRVPRETMLVWEGSRDALSFLTTAGEHRWTEADSFLPVAWTAPLISITPRIGASVSNPVLAYPCLSLVAGGVGRYTWEPHENGLL